MTRSCDIEILHDYLGHLVEMFGEAHAAGRGIEIGQHLTGMFAAEARHAQAVAKSIDGLLVEFSELEEIARDLDLIAHAKRGELRMDEAVVVKNSNCNESAEIIDLCDALARERAERIAPREPCGGAVISFPGGRI